MILLNFAHPLTDEQLTQVDALVNQPVARMIDRPAQFDLEQSFAAQVAVLVDAVGLSPADWQALPLVINPPSLSAIAVTLLAELHGRMGYFPAVIRMRPVADSIPPRFEVAEIVNLQAVRDTARSRRQGERE